MCVFFLVGGGKVNLEHTSAVQLSPLFLWTKFKSLYDSFLCHLEITLIKILTHNYMNKVCMFFERSVLWKDSMFFRHLFDVVHWSQLYWNLYKQCLYVFWDIFCCYLVITLITTVLHFFMNSIYMFFETLFPCCLKITLITTVSHIPMDRVYMHFKSAFMSRLNLIALIWLGHLSLPLWNVRICLFNSLLDVKSQISVITMKIRKKIFFFWKKKFLECHVLSRN